MQKIIFLMIVSVILSGCATGYPKVEGELKRVYLAYSEGPGIRRTLIPDKCGTQLVPTGYAGAIVITKDKVLKIPTVKEQLDLYPKNGEEYKLFTEEYKEALEEGIIEHRCMTEEIKRKDTDVFYEVDPRYCPIMRESIYIKEDSEFLEVFKNEVVLRWYLEVPKKLGVKIYNNGLPTIKYKKEIIEKAILPPNLGYCFGMPLKATLPHQWDGAIFKSYPTPKERKNMLKDKDPNIYWEYPHWGGFFTPDGKVNKEKLREIKEAAKRRE
ncbi:MAG: hypothetical protein LBM71_03155 [Elusimicrobiota bacterium]|jgi:hypothetical protein|nr:hypothetical protein [Elusimicrobiota bacterium]